MWVPAFARAHEENIIANILNDVAAVTNTKSESLAGLRRARKEDAKGVVAAGAKFLFSKALVLEIGEGLAGAQGDAFDLENTGKLNEEDTLAAARGAELDGGVALEGGVVVDGGIDVVAEGFERKNGRSGTAERIGGPDIEVGDLVDEAGLAQHEILAAHLVHQDVERSGDDTVDAGVEKVARRGGKSFDDDAKGMRGIESRDLGNPKFGERGVGGGLKAGTIELRQEVLRGVVGEAHVNRDKLLVENGSTEKTGHLLLFDGVPRESQGVAESGEDNAGDAAFEGFKKGELSLFEGEYQVGLTQLNAVRGRDGVNLMRVKAKGIERVQKFTRRSTVRKTGCGHRKKAGSKSQEKTHTRSVVTFGMREQGEQADERAEV